jgi:hypothetical protein
MKIKKAFNKAGLLETLEDLGQVMTAVVERLEKIWDSINTGRLGLFPIEVSKVWLFQG